MTLISEKELEVVEGRFRVEVLETGDEPCRVYFSRPMLTDQVHF
jgi:hypothetical protein